MVEGKHSNDIKDSETNRNISDQREDINHDYDDCNEEDIDNLD